VIELKREGQEKRARRVTTRPEPTIFWQLRKLELHCRQKGPDEKPQTLREAVVATQQHLFYQQLIHSFQNPRTDNMWAICGSSAKPLGVSHIVGFNVPQYAAKAMCQGSILTKTAGFTHKC
jgi:hypothetical protein